MDRPTVAFPLRTLTSTGVALGHSKELSKDRTSTVKLYSLMPKPCHLARASSTRSDKCSYLQLGGMGGDLMASAKTTTSCALMGDVSEALAPVTITAESTHPATRAGKCHLTSALGGPREALTWRRGRENLLRARGAHPPAFHRPLQRTVKRHLFNSTFEIRKPSSLSCISSFRTWYSSGTPVCSS